MQKGRGEGNVPPPAILIKLIDVANYCGKIFNCILARKRIKTEFPSLCYGTVRSRHSGVLYRVDTQPRVYADSPCHQKGLIIAVQSYLGFKGEGGKRASAL